MNRMEQLLNKVERRLGTKLMNLPPELQKDKWADIVNEDTLTTFSRYFPHKVQIIIGRDTPKKNGWYIIDESLPESTEILGVGDIDWARFSRDGIYSMAYPYGFIENSLSTQYGIQDVFSMQSYSDLMSVYNVQIVPVFQPPNMIKILDNSGSDVLRGIKMLPLDILVKHPINLMTISQTMMEIFEELAMADIASFLYQNLKFFDGLETVYANIDLKLSDLGDRAGKREDIVKELDDAHVSASNPNQPMIYTV